MVPEGWQSKQIGEIAKVQVGRDVQVARFSETRTEQHVYPVFSNTVDEQGLYGFYDFEEYPGGAVTVVGRGIGLGTAFYKERPFGAIGRLVVLHPRDGAFCPQFLTDYINHRLRIFNESGGIPQLPGSSLARYSVALPPLPEQRKIAEILSTWDRAIETAEALLATARTQKRALMETLLTGKRRFPEFEGQGWREVRLGDVGPVSSAGVDKKTDPNQPEVRLLNFLDVFRREFIVDSELDHVVTAPPAKVEQCNVRRGDVFFTPSSETRDEIAMPAVAAEDMPGVCYSYHVVRYRLKEDWDLNFRAFVFQANDFRRQAYRLGDGSGQRYVISQNNFRQMLVRVPGLVEQKKIGLALKAASDEVGRLEKDIEELRTEKKAIMQQLLTGKRRVQV